MDDMFNLNPKPIPKCKNCGRDKGSHRAQTFNCPIGRGLFPQYNLKQVYEPKPTRKKKG